MNPRRRASDGKAAIDPIDLEVMWSRLLTVVDEAAYAIIRTSMSKVVTEGRDFGVVLFDPAGQQIAADVSIASKTGTISIAVQEILKHFPAESFRPGDIVATNNPWWIMGHLNDVAVIGPLFYRGKLVGFAECMAHMADIGGSLSGAPRDVFEEGLIIPPLRILRAGVEDATFFAMLEANVRVPRQVAADVRALITGCRVMEHKLAEFLERHAYPDLEQLAHEIIGYSETTMRRGIAAAIPDGVYNGSTTVDGFGDPLTINVQVTAADGGLDIDFTRSAAQSPFGINCTMVYTRVWSAYIIKCIAAPHLPNNSGTFAPIRVHAPEGSFLNPRFPAPVKMKPSSGHYVPIAILDALAGVIPTRTLAESGNKFLVYLAGTHADEQLFSDLMFVMGGMGARADSDGLNCMSFPANSSNLPTEVLESHMPIRVLRRALRPDSGGAGRFRGGLGQVMELQSLSARPITVRAEHGKLATPPCGLRGGMQGAPGRVLHNGKEVPDKLPLRLQQGDVLTLEVPGSGGTEPPGLRDRDALMADLADGLVTPAAALRHYGVTHAG